MNRLLQVLRRHGFDLLIVVAAIVAAVGVALDDEAQWFAVPVVALIVLSLLGRDRFPFGAPVTVWVLAPAFSFVDGHVITSSFLVYLSGIAAAVLLGNLRDGRQARLGLAIVIAGSLIVVHNRTGSSAGDFLFIPGVFVIAWLAGFALRARSSEAEAAEQRAAAAEREQQTAARIAVAEERARIARELHDVVAHAVSVMVLQVGAVRHGLPAELADSKEALQGVEQAGRAALAEMRQLLGAMRDTSEDLELAPQPGLGDLDNLLADVRRAGLPAQLHVEGVGHLPRGIDLSAYRIVQEGLTNALKHAHARSADVTIRYGDDRVEIAVRDDGTGPGRTDGLGHGLVGVGERVKIYGGHMTTGPAPGGGFLLSACIPVDRGER